MVFQRRGRRGFTFIELIFVITLMAILAAVTLPQFRRSFDSLVLQNFVSDFTSLAMYAQAKAINGGTETSVDLDLSQKRILAGDHKVKAIPDSVLVDLKEGTGKVVFYPDGTSDKADFEVRGKYGGKYSISVDPGTGYVNAKETD